MCVSINCKGISIHSECMIGRCSIQDWHNSSISFSQFLMFLTSYYVLNQHQFSKFSYQQQYYFCTVHSKHDLPSIKHVWSHPCLPVYYTTSILSVPSNNPLTPLLEQHTHLLYGNVRPFCFRNKEDQTQTEISFLRAIGHGVTMITWQFTNSALRNSCRHNQNITSTLNGTTLFVHTNTLMIIP